MDDKTKQIATDLAYQIIREVGRAIRPYIGKEESGEKVNRNPYTTQQLEAFWLMSYSCIFDS